MNLLIDNTVRITLIMLVGLGARFVLRRRSAAVRHWVLAVSILCAASAPMLGAFVPVWEIGTFSAPAAAVTADSSSAVVTIETFSTESASPGQALSPVRAGGGRGLAAGTTIAWLGLTWVVGAAISLLVLGAGLAHLTWLASRARRVEEGRWADLAREVAAAVELRRPVAILRSDHPTLLVTWGVVQPKVILPAVADEWSDERARVVLRHEFAHIARGDWVVFMAAELLRAVYWFNPLVWIACIRVRQDSENACDDAVLSAGIAGPDYATHLLDLARTLNANRRTSQPPLPAPAMARPSSLQGRISAMLNASVNRGPLTPSIRVASVVAFLALTVLLAGVGAQRFYTLSGSVLDATNRNLPDVKLVATNAASQAKHEVRSDRTGHFEFVGLPPGEYSLEASLPGFANVKDTVIIIGRDINRTIDMHVGSLEETITIRSSTSRPDPEPTAEQLVERQKVRARAQERQRTALERCAGGVPGAMGGQILAPLRLTNVNPRYPESLRATGTGGVVTLDALIGTDGNIQQVRAVSSPHPDLEAAAIEAVRQWQYTPTLLNCVPTEVPMKVTLRFNTTQE
jgi:TonB family protein